MKTSFTLLVLLALFGTASAEKSEEKMAMDFGAERYGRNPFDVAELMEPLMVC